MARNFEADADTFQTALAVIDYTIADPSNLPTVGPLNQPSNVSLNSSLFTVGADESITATATRVMDCAPPPRARTASSLVAYSAFRYEINTDVDRVAGGLGRSSMAQGYILLGPKC